MTIFAGDIIDLIWRDTHRRLIEHDAFDVAFRAAIAVLRERNNDRIDEATAVERLQAIHAEALLHPVPLRKLLLPPLRADEIGVGEVVALLRRVIAGESEIVVERPWSEVCHTHGLFEIDGWKFLAFKRNYGVKYIAGTVAPDGRRGTIDTFDAREGDPVMLLTNAEQDAFDDIIESCRATTNRSREG